MRISLWHTMPWPYTDVTGHTWPFPSDEFDPERASGTYREYIEEIVLADRLGFDWVVLGEEHMTPYGVVPNPAVVAGAVSSMTSRIGIALIGSPLAVLNPLRIAEEYALVDVLSGGRLVAGLVRGVPRSYLAYGIERDGSWPRYAEACRFIVAAWAAPSTFSFHGEHLHYDDIALWPRPRQPRPPLVMPATTPDSAVLAAELGAVMAVARLKDPNGLVQWATCMTAYEAEAGHRGQAVDPGSFLAALHACVAPSDDEAIAILTEAEDYVYNTLSGSPKPEGASRWTTQERIEGGTVICGSPATVAEQLRRLEADFGIGRVALNFKVGNIDHDLVVRSMRLVGPMIGGGG